MTERNKTLAIRALARIGWCWLVAIVLAVGPPTWLAVWMLLGLSLLLAVAWAAGVHAWQLAEDDLAVKVALENLTELQRDAYRRGIFKLGAAPSDDAR